MIHLGAAGAFGAPKEDREPPAECFRVGDVRQNSRGTPHRVTHVDGGIAYMINEKTGRTYHRGRSDLGWRSGKIWVRLSCG